MKRIWIVLLLLLTGTIINVAVAWGIALASATGAEHDVESAYCAAGKGFSNWYVRRFRRSGTVNVESKWMNGAVVIRDPMPEQVAANLVPAWAGFAMPGRVEEWTPEERTVTASGWPCLSLWSGQDVNFTKVRRVNYYCGQPMFSFIPGPPSLQCGFSMTDLPRPLDGWAPRSAVLPLGPCWPGLVINTLVYAITLGFCTHGLPWLHRNRRARCGLCLQCGYDLRGAPPESLQCSECGRRLPSSEFA